MAKKKNKSMTLRDVGKNLSLTELMKISKGNDPLKVMSKALDKGIGIGRKAVNAYNTPGGLGNYVYQGTPDNLKPLKGLTLGKRQVYQGASTYTTPSSRTSQAGWMPGSVTYNPIVGLRKSKADKKGGGKNNDNTNQDQNIKPADTPYTPQPMDVGGGMDFGGGMDGGFNVPDNSGIPDPSFSPGGAGFNTDAGATGFRRKRSSAALKGLTTKGPGQLKISGQTSKSSGLNIGVG